MCDISKAGYKIFHLISSSGFLGAESVVLELAKEGTAAGHCIIIGILKNEHNPHLELAEIAKTLGLKVEIFPCRGRFDLSAIKSIRRFINLEKPDLIHSHGYKSNFYAMSANRNEAPWVVTNHLWKRTSFNLKMYAYLDSFLIKYAKKIVAVSNEIASDMLERGIPGEKIIVIDNGIDLNRFSKDKNIDDIKGSFGFKTNFKIIGTVASLTKEKGHPYLFEAAKTIVSTFPEARVLIVGDGRERHHLEKKVSELGLYGKVIFAGSRRDIPEILSILDIFVLPSLKEGLPMALLEAMAARLPIVATRVGAVSKVVLHEETGLLVDPGNSEALCAAISDLLSDKSQAGHLGLQGYIKVKKEFSSKTMAERYFSVYRALLS